MPRSVCLSADTVWLVLSGCLNCMTCMAAYAFHMIVLAPHMYFTCTADTQYYTCNSCCANTLHLPHFPHKISVCFKVHVCFHYFWTFCCYFHPFVSLYPPFYLLLTSPSLGSLLPLSLNLQSRLWSAPVRSLRDAHARCAPPAHLGAVLSQWWRWRRSLSSPRLASLNTLGSSTCFSSERQHHCGR